MNDPVEPMDREQIERSIERTTGYIVWAYVLLVFAVWTYFAPDGPGISNGWPLWKDLAYILSYIAILSILIFGAGERGVNLMAPSFWAGDDR